MYVFFSKMATYSKEEYVTGSDFSDLSDVSEDDLHIDDLLDISSESDEDDGQYCVCGKPSTIEMIACDDDQCNIVWWHYDCAGLSTGTIPDGSWLCERCRPSGSGDTGRLTTAAVTVKSKKSSYSSKKADKTGEGDTKKTRKASKPASKRPEANFTKEDACQRASSYFKSGLKQVRQHPVFTAKYPIALCLMSFIIKLTAVTDHPEFQEFCVSTVTAMWMALTAGDTKNLKPEGYELVWRTFHNFRLESVQKWKELLVSLNLYEEGKHINIAYQYLLQTIIELLLKDRNQTDLPSTDSASEPKPITKDEEQVLRYVAGYVPFALKKKLTNQINPTAQIFCKFLKSWQVCSSDTAKTFLEYTNQWIEIQNRGGLFHVSDGVYLLFRTMEVETRNVLTVADMDMFPGVDIQSKLIDKIRGHRRVQTYWCSLTQGKINGDLSGKLLDMLIKKWIKIRAKAFINVYLNLKKLSGAKVGKKAEKALRKDL